MAVTSVTDIDTLVKEELSSSNEILDKEKSEKELKESARSSLANYIIRVANKNRDDKRNSGIEDEILNSLLQFNGEYSSRDKALIAEEGGSSIFMNLTATKARAAKSWIADIYSAAKGKTWALESTPNPELPEEIVHIIEEAIQKEFTQIAPQPGQQATTAQAQETIKVINQNKRDILDAVMNEISKEASFQMKRMEKKVKDQLIEGKWHESLLTFIDDFVIYPTAFLKGPVVTKQQVLKWENGKPVQTEEYVFCNERVDPLDIYPSAGATSIQDGDLCEHLRFTNKSAIAHLKDTENYKSEAIDRVLLNGSTGSIWIDDYIEQEKEDQERKGSLLEDDTIHGIHFFGQINSDLLKEWDKSYFKDLEDDSYIEVEAILVGDEVIKCVVNDDPLLRRPYYKASFINRPGSFWGRSLPMLMADIQRMCNAAARALANNMAVCSGPQVEIYIDRLADDGPIEAVAPMRIWQLKSDPTGAGGRAINFFQPVSKASELLAVYDKCEQKADDVTGIPRWAYGNENIAGAGATASGLSMLLESASKIIKDAIRNIDVVVKGRVEYQFYYNLLKEEDSDFTGDIKVIPLGSTVLTIKAFEAMRRNEFLTITANEFDQRIIGDEGRGDILRLMAEDLGLPSSAIPTSFEIRQKEKATQEREAQNAKILKEAEDTKSLVGLKATQIQIDGQKEMAQGAQELQAMKARMKDAIDQSTLQLKQQKLAQEEISADRDRMMKENLQLRELALSLKQNHGI